MKFNKSVVMHIERGRKPFAGHEEWINWFMNCDKFIRQYQIQSNELMGRKVSAKLIDVLVDQVCQSPQCQGYFLNMFDSKLSHLFREKVCGWILIAIVDPILYHIRAAELQASNKGNGVRLKKILL
jgi:hypothetical protein